MKVALYIVITIKAVYWYFSVNNFYEYMQSSSVFWLALIPTIINIKSFIEYNLERLTLYIKWQCTLQTVTKVTLNLIHLLADHGKGFSQLEL
jgi:hypothetical protein